MGHDIRRRKGSGSALLGLCSISHLREASNPLDKVYGGMRLGGKSFIKEALKLVNDNTPKKETAQRRTLTSRVSDIDEMVHLLSIYFKVPEGTITNASPYRAYAIYLSRNHTPVSSTEIGGYFGNIPCSAVTK